ncbi:MAG: phosphohistidine phosphatase SixA [Phycisphaerales bacterium]|nr:phosphohistidine phosphatase SixA [Phycisphaerales bacterium]
MDLLLIRHGEALPVGRDGIASDYDRVLSNIGKRKSTAAGEALTRLGVHLDAILFSPLPRAEQTVGALVERFEGHPACRACPEMAPGANWDTLVKELRRNSELSAIALVGHEPDLSGMAARVLGGDDLPRLIFHTGSIACIHLELKSDPPDASLRWFLDSAQLEWIARGQ